MQRGKDGNDEIPLGACALKAVVSGAGGDVAITCGELLFNPNATLADK